MKKPNAITVIEETSFKEKIWNLPASDLLGVGRATNKTLSKYGIYTIGNLAQADPKFMQQVLGKNGVARYSRTYAGHRTQTQGTREISDWSRNTYTR